jgi:hypothetical protein
MRFILGCFFLFSSFFIEGARDHRYISEKVWEIVDPYLMPDDHPAKAKLDEIFTRSRATTSIKTMEKAGFENVVPQPHSRIIVTKHPELEGYILKLYLDAQRYYRDTKEYFFYVSRAQGAEKIRNLLDEKDWNHLFKAPKKWIYVLPVKPSPPDELLRKNFILVEEDMNIYDDSMNRQMWQSDMITYDVLDKFYFILEEIGLWGCARPRNAPISKDGRIAFVDTQSHNCWPVSWDDLDPFLTPEMLAYWKQLTR